MQNQTIWDRRIVNARNELGLLEWELESKSPDTAAADALLRSPMPGASSLLCTSGEILIRQQLLARNGLLEAMHRHGSAGNGAMDTRATAEHNPCAQDTFTGLEQDAAVHVDNPEEQSGSGSQVLEHPKVLHWHHHPALLSES